MRLPKPRGAVSAAIFEQLRGTPPEDGTQVSAPSWTGRDPLVDEDLQISLWAMYELHYRGFADVDERWEWAPALLAVRQQLESAFETELRSVTAAEVDAVVAGSGPLADRLFALTESFEGPELAKYVYGEADREQVREFLLHRSVYHLKEADPLTWVIPRLEGDPKAHLVELQLDEYGGGAPGRVHQELFAETMRRTGLDSEYGAYIDEVPAATLATNNALSLFGLHRRLRGAALGHLGAFEATSSIPCRRYAGGLRRLGFDEQAAHYFDEHIEADAVHEQLALRGICERLAADDPGIERDIVFGAVTCLVLESRLSTALLAAWESGGHLVEPPSAGLQVSA